MDKNYEQIIEENFAYIDKILERDLGINLHPEEPVYENTETMEELQAWIEEQVYGPEEEKWNDVALEGVNLIPMEAVRGMIESGELEIEEDGFPDQIAARIKDELFDPLDEFEYCIPNNKRRIYDITRYTLNEWHCMRPDEFKYLHGGLEWDYVAYIDDYLYRNYPLVKRKSFIMIHVDENGPTSIPFILYNVGRKWYYHDSAHKNNIVHLEFDSAAEAIEKIAGEWKNQFAPDHGITAIKEYDPYDHYDLHFDEFYKSIFEDYPNWIKKYSEAPMTESGYILDLFESKEKSRQHEREMKDFRKMNRYKQHPLRYAFALAWDYDTGHELKLVYEFDEDTVIEDVGDAYYLQNHPDNSKKDKNVAKQEYLDDVRKYVRIKGNSDFSSKKHTLVAIQDVVTGDYLSRTVTIISPIFLEIYFWERKVNIYSYHPDLVKMLGPDRFNDLRMDAYRRRYVRPAGKMSMDLLPYFKSTYWPKMSREREMITSRFDLIKNMEGYKHLRGQEAQSIAIVGSKPHNDYIHMKKDEIIYDMSQRIAAIEELQNSWEAYRDGLRESYYTLQNMAKDGMKISKEELSAIVRQNNAITKDIDRLEIIRRAIIVDSRNLENDNLKIDKAFVDRYEAYSKEIMDMTKDVYGLSENAVFVFDEDVAVILPSKGDALRELLIRRSDLYSAMERGEIEYTSDLDRLNDDIWYIINVKYDPAIMLTYGTRKNERYYEIPYLNLPVDIDRRRGGIQSRVRNLDIDRMDTDTLNVVNESLIMYQDPRTHRSPLSEEYLDIESKYYYDRGPRVFATNIRSILERVEQNKEDVPTANTENTSLPEVDVSKMDIPISRYPVDQSGDLLPLSEFMEHTERDIYGTDNLDYEPFTESDEKNPVKKNGVNRKNLYIAFIQYAQKADPANKLETNFTKNLFDGKFKDVPESMRYFYRLADPTQCILNDGLVFFSLKNAYDINKKNSDITKYYIFAAINDLFYVVDQNNGAVHAATEEQLRHVKVGKKMASSFDEYVQKLVNNGDYLDGKVVPPDDRPKDSDKKEK